MLAQALIEATVFTAGMSGFYVTFTQHRHVWHHGSGEQLSYQARQRRTRARSLALKEKYGSGLMAAATVLLLFAALPLMCLIVLVPCAVFHHNSFLSGVSTGGILLWFRRFTYWLEDRL